MLGKLKKSSAKNMRGAVLPMSGPPCQSRPKEQTEVKVGYPYWFQNQLLLIGWRLSWFLILPPEPKPISPNLHWNCMCRGCVCQWRGQHLNKLHECSFAPCTSSFGRSTINCGHLQLVSRGLTVWLLRIYPIQGDLWNL